MAYSVTSLSAPSPQSMTAAKTSRAMRTAVEHTCSRQRPDWPIGYPGPITAKPLRCSIADQSQRHHPIVFEFFFFAFFVSFRFVTPAAPSSLLSMFAQSTSCTDYIHYNIDVKVLRQIL